MLLNIAILHIAFATKLQSSPRIVRRYAGTGCNAAALIETWTIISATSTDLERCTIASLTSSSSSSSSHSIDNLALLQSHGVVEGLHLRCSAGTAEFGAYNYDGSAQPSCNTERISESFAEAQYLLLSAGNCANTVGGNSVEVDTTNLVLPTCAVGVSGDPHLTNLRGQKFDIHDGLHRLVHYPRDAPEEEALFKLDAKAVDTGPEADCYSVFLQNIKLSGKWVGDDISLSTNTSMASSNPSAFGMSFALQKTDWVSLNKQFNGHLQLKGSMPVTVTTSTRNASADEMGGEEINFKVGGDQHPMLVEVWSSHGQNWVTHGKDVRFLNVHVKNLPKDAGGILGMDSYTKPSDSRCGLVQQERDLMNYIGKDLSLLSVTGKKKKTFLWTASAAVQQ
eukprot:TRINITY_DN2815_c0_g1_i2.p1 TRINITY_DN2815_c0_g1~~TRINITY_DN2815_c0_g1_i2.p1  ORF type:complete len:394 (-),score=80.57 TRINITY_DN2815_c0_g1_i2:109-1290(-)